MSNALSLKNISYSYHTVQGETCALKDISLDIPKGSFVSIVGPSGCGKSTLLSIIAGIIRPDSGRIMINGRDISPGNDSIGYMLQHDHLFEWRSIYGNVMLGLEIKRKKKSADTCYVDELLERYGLGEFKASRPSELSGGMRQRAALIRTLALEPEILLLDEPFSALDYQTRLTVCDDIYSIIKNEHKTAVLVTHDLSEAISVGDTIYVLSRRPGQIARSVSVDFPADMTPLMRRNTPEFKDYFNILWKELNENG
ncbi:MAG: ABC transporter ATP-binding protein [Lachnospiraceae bacterium]|nr:ABC transporter ATP-binding protein [Lachnospiraceae bacterium]